MKSTACAILLRTLSSISLTLFPFLFIDKSAISSRLRIHSGFLFSSRKPKEVFRHTRGENCFLFPTFRRITNDLQPPSDKTVLTAILMSMNDYVAPKKAEPQSLCRPSSLLEAHFRPLITVKKSPFVRGLLRPPSRNFCGREGEENSIFFIFKSTNILFQPLAQYNTARAR